jgi:hypothetical protein
MLLAALFVSTLASARVAHSIEMLAGQRLSVEVTGGTTAVAPERFATAGTALMAPLHVNPYGKMCLTVTPQAKSQAINPAIYDHILVLNNTCAQRIRIRACYYKTTNCTTMSVAGYRREQHNLGIFPSKDFRYSYREYVN